MLITWVGGVAGASSCFWIARTFGARLAERICSQFKIAGQLNHKLEQHAFVAIIMARLIPGVPFDFLSYFVGLTRVRFLPFLVATAIGSAPHAFLYAFMGSSLQIPLWLGVLMTPALGLLFAIVKYGVTLVRRAEGGAEHEPGTTPAPSFALPSFARAQALPVWVAAMPLAACRAARPIAVTAWATAPVMSRARPVLR
jgi:membrane protein DedA with SNARE-associated domain